MAGRELVISVIVPIYNIEDYLNRCIESIVNQTYRYLDIILVDDGSTDNSSQICDVWENRDSRIRVIHKNNGGLVSARKAGLEIAIGTYATYVDGDDWIDTTMYEVFIKNIKNADVLVSGVKRVYSDKLIKEINKIEDGIYEGECLKKKIYTRMIHSGKIFERGIQPHVYNCLYKRELLLENQMQIDERINVGEDAACIYPLLLSAKRVAVISNCFYYYDMRQNSIMGINDGQELKKLKILYRYLTDRFTEEVEIKDNLINQLNYFMIYTLLLKEIGVLQGKKGFLFPYGKIAEESRLILYGAGRFGCELFRYIRKHTNYKIVSWVDNNSRDNILPVYTIEKVKYDYIVIAVLIKDISDIIKKELLLNGVKLEKILTLNIEMIEEKKVDVPQILS